MNGWVIIYALVHFAMGVAALHVTSDRRLGVYLFGFLITPGFIVLAIVAVIVGLPGLRYELAWPRRRR